MANLRIPFFILLVLTVGLSACSSNTSSSSPPTSYRDVGPYEAGVTTLTLADRMVEVWYPVNRGDVAGLDPVPYFIRDELSGELDSLLPDDVNPPFPTAAFRDARASGSGPFPLVMFAHGSASYRNQSTFLTTHLASWGFVVASDTYADPADLAANGASIWSPRYSTLTEQHVVDAHNAGLAVIPWTVNETADMATMISIGVDGIITDRPDLLLSESS